MPGMQLRIKHAGGGREASACRLPNFVRYACLIGTTTEQPQCQIVVMDWDSLDVQVAGDRRVVDCLCHAQVQLVVACQATEYKAHRPSTCQPLCILHLHTFLLSGR
jgi:hypothetical protein